MHVVVHVKGHYDWMPVPANVTITEQDISTGKVRPAAAGGYNMRVNRTADAHTTISLSEGDIIGTIIQAYCEHGRCGAVLTRAEAVARYLGTVVMPLHAHPKWFKHIEVHDDVGPDEDLLKASLEPHLLADHGTAPGKNIEAEDLDDLVEAYMTPMEAAHHAAHLHKHFKIKAPTTAVTKGSEQ